MLGALYGKQWERLERIKVGSTYSGQRNGEDDVWPERRARQHYWRICLPTRQPSGFSVAHLFLATICTYPALN